MPMFADARGVGVFGLPTSAIFADVPYLEFNEILLYQWKNCQKTVDTSMKNSIYIIKILHDEKKEHHDHDDVRRVPFKIRVLQRTFKVRNLHGHNAILEGFECRRKL